MDFKPQPSTEPDVLEARPAMPAFMTCHLKSTFLAALGLLALGASTGCISTRETVYSDAPRAKIAFASDKAGRVFYETLSSAPEGRRRTEKHTEVNLILIDVDRRTVTGPNQLFNEAVAFCDTNHDGTITETEAEIFSHAWPAAKD
jgi:hypothetical protein